MSDKAHASIKATIGVDKIRHHLSGNYDFTSDTELQDNLGEGWVYGQRQVGLDRTNPTYVIIGSMPFFGSSIEQPDGNDEVSWLAMRVPKTDINGGTDTGILLAFHVLDDPGSGIVLDWNDANSDKTMVIGPGELFVMKTNDLCRDRFRAISVTVDTYGMPTSLGSSAVHVDWAIMMKNIAGQ